MAMPKADTSELVYLAAILAALERLAPAPTPPAPVTRAPRTRKAQP